MSNGQLLFLALPLLPQILGMVGRVAQIYPDGDLKIDIRGSLWTLNPKNVSRVEGDGMPLTPGTSGKAGWGRMGVGLTWD